MEIEFTINKVLKQGDDDDNDSDDSSKSKTENLQEDYTKLSEKCDSLAKKIEKIESVMNKEMKLPTQESYDILVKRIDNIEKKMNKKEEKMETNEKAERIYEVESEKEKEKKKIPLPECPVCLTDMGPGVKIVQCSSGHLLCWTCKEKLSSPQCPTCQEPVNNRAHGMENYIMTLLQYL